MPISIDYYKLLIKGINLRPYVEKYKLVIIAQKEML
jgi:hypothetical protein